MKPDEIKKTVDFLTNECRRWSDEKHEHKRRIDAIQENIDSVSAHISYVRSLCKHVYPKKKKGDYGFMGKGCCEICGENDY